MIDYAFFPYEIKLRTTHQSTKPVYLDLCMLENVLVLAVLLEGECHTYGHGWKLSIDLLLSFLVYIVKLPFPFFLHMWLESYMTLFSYSLILMEQDGNLFSLMFKTSFFFFFFSEYMFSLLLAACCYGDVLTGPWCLSTQFNPKNA